MRISILVFIMILAVASTIQAALPIEMQMYLRAGSGSSSGREGGAQECIRNRGASAGNEFRLGNECGLYGEFGFGSRISPEWRFFSNFAVSSPHLQDWDSPNTQAWVLREAYAEVTHPGGAAFSAWVGKRFYRWGDLHLLDFYPIAMNGPGGGIGGLRSNWGLWSIALLQTRTTTSDAEGIPTETSLHLRLDEIPLFGAQGSAWLAGAHLPGGRSGSGPDTRMNRRATGGLIAFKSNFTITEGWDNETGVAFGQGILSRMGPESPMVPECGLVQDPDCGLPQSFRLRFWNALHFESSRWSGQLSLVYDDLDRGLLRDGRQRWSSLGFRPMYWFTDQVSLSFQAGVSSVLDDQDGLGTRNLMRLTLAPQISMGKGFFSRPVLRFFVSRTLWTANNKISVQGTSAETESFQDSVGLQTEIWF